MEISRKEALDCLRSDDLVGIGMEADAVRRRLHPEGVVSYAIECSIDCTALASSARVEGNAGEAALDGLYIKIAGTVERGSTGVRLVSGASGIGGLGSQSKSRGIEWLEGLSRGIRQSFPSLWIEALSPAEIVALAADSGLDLRQTIARLRDAGMDSIAGEDAAVNIGNRIARPTCSLAEWIAVHRAAHGLEMRTVATMHFDAGEAGAGEAVDQCVDLLAAVRLLQQETGGFTAFIPRNLPSRNASGGWDGPTAVEQLKTLAVARIFLDNIENIQLSGAAHGLKVLQMGLRFGANDAGSVTPEALGAKAGNGAGAGIGANAAAVAPNPTANQPTEEDLRRIIRDAGFQPVQRDASYRMMFLN